MADQEQEPVGYSPYTETDGQRINENAPPPPKSQQSYIAVAKSFRFIVRAIEWLLALLCFALAASPEGAVINGSGFMVFVGVSAWLFCTFFIALYLIEDRLSDGFRRFLPLIELALSVLWVIFFFASSINYAVKAGQASQFYSFVGQARASSAFGFFSSFCWIASCYFAWGQNTIPLRGTNNRGTVTSV